MATIQVLSEPREHLVREELAALLESATFRTSKRCREFLAYTVEQTLSGECGRLKERSIGVDLFRLPHDYDTAQHTIVRVTASEVRKKLAQHYVAEEVAGHQVRIELPPGSYSAEFRWVPQERKEAAVPVAGTPIEVVSEEAAQGRWEGIRWQRAIAWAAAVLALVAGLAAFRWWAPSKPVSMNAESTHMRGVVPTEVSREVRLVAGMEGTYIDRNGKAWGADRYFSGGLAVSRPAEKILRTLDPDIYRHMRSGDFRYDIPLPAGNYELHLHFAETGLADFISAESSGEGQRVFAVSINGKRVLDTFDVVADADGPDVSDVRVFRNVHPGGDGFLHLSFSSLRGSATLSGLEVLPMGGSESRTVRIRAGWTTSWRDSNGQEWTGDTYFLGGNALVRKTNPIEEQNAGAQDMALYTSERWGHFSYAIPVADGRYKVRLRFCESHYGPHNSGVGGEGSRVFDVYGNGVALLKNFDIYREAGGEGKPIERTFSNIEPTAQGKINLTFVPVKGMACVNGIEVSQQKKWF